MNNHVMSSPSPPIVPLEPRRARCPVAAVLAVLLACLAPPASATLDPELFPIPEELEANVEFWTKVYAVYDSHHVLLHDELYMHVIYEAIDMTAIDEAETSESRLRQARRQKIRDAEAKYRAILTDLASGRESDKYAEDQARVARMFESVPGKDGSGKDHTRYSGSIGRMRTQTCLKDRFAEGIERSGLYMGRIEEIFERYGMPVELSRLPFVESLFQIRAHSSAAAVGIWQFVRPTARNYLKMELEYDERYDPLAASDGAARHLKDNYELLESWPLAITAYNHGANGMRRAVRLLGTRDLGRITERYRSRSFGFASRNFYSEFVAAVRVYENRAEHFPDVEPLPAVEFETFVAERYVPVGELAGKASASLDELEAMNPALGREVWSDDLYLPAKYELRVPVGKAAAFHSAYNALEEELKSLHQVGLYYRVKGGDTLGKVARKFGTTIPALQRVNNLRSAHIIRIGQTLLIPPARGSSSARTPTSTTAAVIAGAPPPSSHVVRKGETLSSIARRYGVSIDSLRAANPLADADRIFVGQQLSVPGADQRVHVVRKGETLAKIAARYGISVRDLKEANRLRDDLIHPAQVLVIP